MTNEVDTLKKRFPVTHGRDHGQRVTLGEIIRRMGNALDADASKESRHDVSCDILDRDLLFGAWGDSWDERDVLLLRDIRGAIISAYEAGKAKAQSQDSSKGAK